ncbi:MAG: hypothetical protein ACFFBS_05920 [Promethearchaeota archaeon]
MEFNPERFGFEHENRPERIIIKKEHHKINVAGQALGPLREGDRMEIPRWQADILVENGIAEYLDEKEIDVSKLHNILWKETSDVKLGELDEDFYFEIRKKLRSLKERNQKEPTPITSQKLEQIEVPVRDLISARLSKMVKMALKDIHPSLTGTMTSEELWLYERLAKLIRDWSSMIL